MRTARETLSPAAAARAGTRLLRHVEDLAAGRVVPGVRAALLRVDTPLLGATWSAATGPGGVDGSPLTVDAAFRIASVTKMLTTTVVLALVDHGVLSLDDPIARHLPAHLLTPIEAMGGPGVGDDITVRHLLDHTSGLPDVFPAPEVQQAISQGDARRRFTPVDLLQLAATRGPLTAAPGRGRSYTDTGFVVAGLLVEHRTGAPLQAAYRELILDPAGMSDTWLESSDEPPRRRHIARHWWDGRDITNLDPTVDWAGGGLVSTAADLGAFLRALTSGALLHDETWRAMRDWAPGPAGYYDDYGLGLGRYLVGDVEMIGHHGIWGAFAFSAPALDAVITGTVSAAKVDRRKVLAPVVAALTETMDVDAPGRVQQG